MEGSFQDEDMTVSISDIWDTVICLGEGLSYSYWNFQGLVIA